MEERITRSIARLKQVGVLLPLILALGLTLFALPISAQSPIAGEDTFDASRYDAETFVDTDFSKCDYKELQSTGSSGMSPWTTRKHNDLFPGLFKQGEETPVPNTKKRLQASGVTAVKVNAEDISSATGGENLSDVSGMAPVYDLAGDWVPDTIRLTSNGGFSDAPFNAAVVPYRLNGHVDVQRGRP